MQAVAAAVLLGVRPVQVEQVAAGLGVQLAGITQEPQELQIPVVALAAIFIHRHTLVAQQAAPASSSSNTR